MRPSGVFILDFSLVPTSLECLLVFRLCASGSNLRKGHSIRIAYLTIDDVRRPFNVRYNKCVRSVETLRHRINKWEFFKRFTLVLQSDTFIICCRMKSQSWWIHCVGVMVAPWSSKYREAFDFISRKCPISRIAIAKCVKTSGAWSWCVWHVSLKVPRIFFFN